MPTAVCIRQQEHQQRVSRWQMFAETEPVEESTPGCLKSFAVAHQLMIVIKRAAPAPETQPKERR